MTMTSGRIIAFALLIGRCLSLDQCLDCTPSGRPNLKCDVLPTTACKRRPPGIYESSPGFYPGAPRDLKVETYMRYFPGNKIGFPTVNISFRGPDDASLTFIKGFELTLTIVSGEQTGKLAICRLFDMSKANITNDDVIAGAMTEFLYKGCFNRLMSHTSYWVRVLSLPEPSTVNSDYKDVSVYIHTPGTTASVDVDNTANWAFYIQTVVENNRLKVSFSKPPDVYGFQQFRVSLLRYRGNKEGKVFPSLVAQQEVFDSPVVFEVECPGPHGVWYEQFAVFPTDDICTMDDVITVAVEPIDIYLYKKNKCLCKLNGACDLCLVSTSEGINITSGSPTCSTTKTSTSRSPQSTAAGSDQVLPTQTPETVHFGIFFGASVSGLVVIVIIVVGAIILSRRHERGKHRPPLVDTSKGHLVPDSLTTPVTKNLPSSSIGMHPSGSSQHLSFVPTVRTIFILYYPDSSTHRSRVHELASCLEQSYFMNVILHDQCPTAIGIEGWLQNTMKRVDWIVIMNSKGAIEQFRPKSYPNQRLPSDNEMFSCAIGMIRRPSLTSCTCLSNKCISVYFSNTAETDLIPQFTPQGIHFKLMEDVKSFATHVHGPKQRGACDCYSRPTEKHCQNISCNCSGHRRQRPSGTCDCNGSQKHTSIDKCDCCGLEKHDVCGPCDGRYHFTEDDLNRELLKKNEELGVDYDDLDENYDSGFPQSDICFMPGEENLSFPPDLDDDSHENISNSPFDGGTLDKFDHF